MTDSKEKAVQLFSAKNWEARIVLRYRDLKQLDLGLLICSLSSAITETFILSVPQINI